MLKRIVVGERERALVSRSGRFLRILEPGAHYVAALPFTVGVERHTLDDRRLSSAWSGFLATQRRAIAERHFVIVTTGPREVAVVYADGKFLEIHGPGSCALYWKSAASIGVRIIDAHAAPDVPREVLRAIAHTGAFPFIVGVLVEEGRTGTLYLGNRLARTLGPGMYAFWEFASPRVVASHPCTPALDLAGQGLRS